MTRLALLTPLFLGLVAAGPREPGPLATADGYRGCWYANQPTGDEFAFKYSGGMATYPQQHAPVAVYSAAVHKTFFVYGGAKPGSNSIEHLVSYYDHAIGTVPRPTILLDKKTDDAHDNPTLAIDPTGHLWIFSNAHGTSRPSFVHRQPRTLFRHRVEKIWETNFSYGSPWVLPSGRFLLLHTLYNKGRGLHVTTSPDGREWSKPKMLAKIVEGDYQISWPARDKVGTAFDYHPKGLGLNGRTNLYYLETADAGTTWKTAAGQVVTPPLRDPANAALVRDFAQEHKLVYLKDLNYDAEGHPVILFLTSDGYQPGPKSGPREWFTARFTSAAWEFRPFARSDHNYDHGSLDVESDGTWRIIAPLGAGPQPFGTGGEMQMWTSRDQGKTWVKVRDLTANSPRNHTYARRPLNAHPDFYAIWADGNALKRSESELYFCNHDGSKVFRLPTRMTAATAKPEMVE